MLVLSRQVGQSIVIGDDIFITVLGFRGKQVSLGIDTPDSYVIYRDEIYRKIKAENEANLIYRVPTLHQIGVKR